jgi:hypothetical protein
VALSFTVRVLSSCVCPPTPRLAAVEIPPRLDKKPWLKSVFLTLREPPTARSLAVEIEPPAWMLAKVEIVPAVFTEPATLSASPVERLISAYGTWRELVILAKVVLNRVLAYTVPAVAIEEAA